MAKLFIFNIVIAVCLVLEVSARKSNLYYQTEQFSQQFRDGYNILKYHGGSGPYSERASYGIDRDTPAYCEVDQVIMLKRHGERYPSASKGKEIEKVLHKLNTSPARSSQSRWTGDLAFLNEWSYFVQNSCLYGAETYSGPYAGLLDAYTHGAEYRDRYGHLWDHVSVVPIFASGYARVIETARKFGEGFFGYNYSTNAAVNIIPESGDQGVNSLTPACDPDTQPVCASVDEKILPLFKSAAKRLNTEHVGLDLEAADVYSLMTMAAFELNARAYSDWVDVFTPDEWVKFSYAENLWYYYCAGPGDSYMKAIGGVFVNASLTLLKEGPSAGKMFFNFAHDTDITPIITALDILSPTEHLPFDYIPFGNPWHVENIVPMGGHLTIERLTCNDNDDSTDSQQKYVRIVLNEAVVPFKSCQSGPGFSCPLENFTHILSAQLPNYNNRCNVSAAYPQYLDFWWNYNITTEYNYRDGPVGCGETVV